MQPINIKLTTPIFTGSARPGEMKHIQETSIIGSLRWWYEAIIRGFGGYACDTRAENHACSLDKTTFSEEHRPAMKYEDLSALLSTSGLCPVCQLFGANGWAKQFQLVIDHTTDPLFTTPFGTNVNQVKPAGSKNGYFFSKGIQLESVDFYFRSHQPDNFPNITILHGLLAFIQNIAALGAKNSLSYGRFEMISEIEHKLIINFIDDVINIIEIDQKYSKRENANSDNIPDIRKMFFIDLSSNLVWDANDFCTFKYQLRKAFTQSELLKNIFHDDEASIEFCNYLFGCSTQPVQASKIKLAVDKKNLHLWGWIPDPIMVCQKSVDREIIMTYLFTFIKDYSKKNYKRVVKIENWREYRSSRDDSPNSQNISNFLTSLMIRKGKR